MIEQFINFISRQTSVEKILFFYTCLIAIHSSVIIWLKLKHINTFRGHLKLLSSIYYAIMFLFLVLASLVQEAAIPPFSYHLYIFFVAVALNNLLVKGTLHIKLGDYEIGSESSQLLEEHDEFINITGKIHSLYPAAMQIIDDIRNLHSSLSNAEQDISLFQIYIENILLADKISALFKCTFDINCVTTKAAAENLLKNINATQNLWYNQSTLEKAVNSLYTDGNFSLSSKIQLYLVNINNKAVILSVYNDNDFYTPQLTFLYIVFRTLAVELEWNNI